LKREPTELIVIETPSAVLAADKALDIADYSGEYEGEEDSFDYVDYTAEEERMVAQQGKGKVGMSWVPGQFNTIFQISYHLAPNPGIFPVPVVPGYRIS
jgi:hypothetical protein